MLLNAQMLTARDPGVNVSPCVWLKSHTYGERSTFQHAQASPPPVSTSACRVLRSERALRVDAPLAFSRAHERLTTHHVTAWLTSRLPKPGGVLKCFQYARAKTAVRPGLPERRSFPSSRSKGRSRIVALVSSLIFCSVSSVPSQGATTKPRSLAMISSNSS
jgi:hypothetical protein